jgi:hypothetical protein
VRFKVVEANHLASTGCVHFASNILRSSGREVPAIQSVTIIEYSPEKAALYHYLELFQGVRKMFPGLRSRWTIPRQCAAVEVVLPNDLAEELTAKIDRYIEASLRPRWKG